MSIAQRVCLVLAVLSLAPATQSRGDTPSSGEEEALVLRTQLLEGYQTQRWGEVVQAYRALRELGEIDVRLSYFYSRAQFSSGNLSAATSSLEGILEEIPGHIAALSFLAKLRAQTGQSAQARELLILAARAGGPVLLELSHPENNKTFGHLRHDPKFILAAMQASQRGEPLGDALRDPFQSPLSRSSQHRTSKEPPHNAALIQEIETTFKAIAQLARQGDLNSLRAHLAHVKLLLERLELRGGKDDEGPRVLELLERYRTEFHDQWEVFLSLKLSVMVGLGNKHLRVLQSALQEDEFQTCQERFEQLERLCDDMRAELRPVFARNAHALHTRGESLWKKARLRRDISRLRLEVTGIVIAPPGQPTRAIINDRIYATGDGIEDTAFGVSHPELRVIQIERDIVRFSYESMEFIRPLKRR